MAEKGHGGKAMVNLAKRAKRVQQKMMQRLGKSDQTKDEVFEEFVSNFNKQHTMAVRLQKEITKYMNALRLLHQSTHTLSDVLEELYEPEWEGHGSYKSIVEKQGLLWEDQLTTLQSKMVEPMNHYISRFPEEKSRISKRERKVVDFDLTRRELESIKSKPKVTEQKVQQAEESFTHAKQLYDEITDQLYDGLPTFYDSRIQFYASLFHSLASTEAKFHSEISRVDEEFAELMDSVASQAATGVYSTKKERNVIETGPRLLSRPDVESSSSSDGDIPTPTVSQPTDIQNQSPDSVSPISTPSTTPIRTSSSGQKPSKPVPFSVGDTSSLKNVPPSKPIRLSSTIDSHGNQVQTKEAEEPPQKDDESPVAEKLQSPTLNSSEEGQVKLETTEIEPSPASPTCQEDPIEDIQSPTVKTPPPKPEPIHVPPVEPSEVQPTDESSEEKNPEEDSNSQTTEISLTLFKVQAIHPYQGEDDDELTFEKGEIILVIPYDDPDDEEEGWHMGMVEGTNRRGIFPANFSKQFSS